MALFIKANDEKNVRTFHFNRAYIQYKQGAHFALNVRPVFFGYQKGLKIMFFRSRFVLE